MNKRLGWAILLMLMIAGAAPPVDGPAPKDDDSPDKRPSLKREWFQKTAANKLVADEEVLPNPTPIRPVSVAPTLKPVPAPPVPMPTAPAPMPTGPAPMPTAPASPAPTPTAPAAPPKPAAPVERPFSIDKIGTGTPSSARPDLEKLKREAQRLKNEREALGQYNALSVSDEESTSAAEVAKLRIRLGELMTKMGNKPAPGKPSLPIPGPSTWSPERRTRPTKSADTSHDKSKPIPSVPETPVDAPVDTLALGQTLILTGDYSGGLEALRQVNQQGMKAEDRAPIQYLIATCLRKLGKADEAAQIYRDVASSKGDAFLAECAQWQLSSMGWKKDLESQIQELRQRRQSLEIMKP